MMQRQAMSAHHDAGSEHGFTLIEMLIVVSIVCLITPLVFLNSSRTSDEQKIRHFIEEMDSTISEAQIESMSALSTVRIVFNNQAHYYQLIRAGKLIMRDMDPHIEIYSSNGNSEITINAAGKFTQSKTLICLLGKIQYRIVLLLGQGRHYYEKI